MRDKPQSASQLTCAVLKMFIGLKLPGSQDHECSAHSTLGHPNLLVSSCDTGANMCNHKCRDQSIDDPALGKHGKSIFSIPGL